MYLARHMELEEYRAIKEVPKSRVDYQQFRKEALILKSIRCPGIPIVYDLEETATHFYMIEEHIDGENMYQLISDLGQFSPAMTVLYGIQICRLVNILHSAEPNPILYLDLQPKNLMICHEIVKLVDFDHAVHLNEAEHMTKRYGTVGFAAPEQYTDALLDERTDIYAIGAVLYYMFSGKFPGGQSVYPVKPTDIRLWRVIQRCLRKEPKQRYQSVAELEQALGQVQRHGNSPKQGGRSEKNISSLIIAVAGTASGAGVTHIALGLAAHLRRNGWRALYIEKNLSGAVRQFAEWGKAAMDRYGIFHIRGIALFPDYGQAVKLEPHPYQIQIKDFGEVSEKFWLEAADAYLLVCGSKPWEWRRTEECLAKAAGMPGLALVYNHYCGKLKPSLPYMTRGTHCFFMPYLSDPWKPDRNAKNVYEGLWHLWTGNRKRRFTE